MLLFAHTGITLAVGVLVKNILVRSVVPQEETRKTKISPPSSAQLKLENDNSLGKGITPFPTWLKDHLDYRILIVGSLLPDLIDKPIGGIFFYTTFQNSRIFAHTLCFSVLLIALGLYILVRWRQLWLLTLGFGDLVHLILDQMWLYPRTLLWPAFGWNFPKSDTEGFIGWLPEMIHALTTNASIYIPEIIGFVVLVWFAVRLIRHKQVYAFIRSGHDVK
jgi:hypothetical protein